MIDELLPRQDCGVVVTSTGEIIVFGGLNDAFIFDPDNESGELLLTDATVSVYQGWYQDNMITAASYTDYKIY